MAAAETTPLSSTPPEGDSLADHAAAMLQALELSPGHVEQVGKR